MIWQPVAGRRRVLAAGLATLAAAPARAAADRLNLAAADVHVDGYPTVSAVRWIAREIEQLTGGRITIGMYHAGQLGREKDVLELARLGTLAFARVHSSVLNNAVPATRMLSMPYVFHDTAHLRRVVDSDLGSELLRACERYDVIGLALYDAGARSFYNNRHPIVTPADLHGLKIRVPQSDIFLAAVHALGGNPTSLAFNEVFSALQTHLIDGAENNWPSYFTSRQFEVARFLSLTEHAFAPDVLVMSARIFESMAPGDRELLLDAVQRSVAVMRADWDRYEQDARNKIAAAGVAINAVDKPAFHAAAASLLTGYRRDPVMDRQLARVGELA